MLNLSTSQHYMSKDQLPREIPKGGRKKIPSKTRKQILAAKRQANFLQRQKDKGLVHKHLWIKLPKDKLRKFDQWITSQDPDALLKLVERGSTNDLKFLWEKTKRV